MYMKMIWRGCQSDTVGEPKFLLVVYLIMGRSDYNFQQDIFLKNMNSMWKQVPRARLSVEAVGLQGVHGHLELFRH